MIYVYTHSLKRACDLLKRAKIAEKDRVLTVNGTSYVRMVNNT